MAKKRVYTLLIGLLVYFLFSLSFVYAIDSNASATYLKQEWTKILEQNEVGKIILAFGEVLYSLNPIFKLIIGVEYSFSWYSIFAFLIWISFFVFFFELGRGVFQGKLIIVFILSFIITSFIGMGGAIRQIDDALASFVNDLFVATLILLLSIIILYLLSRFGYFSSKMIADYIKEIEEQRLDSNREIINATGESIRKGLLDKGESSDSIEIFKKEKGSWKKTK